MTRVTFENCLKLDFVLVLPVLLQQGLFNVINFPHLEGEEDEYCKTYMILLVEVGMVRLLRLEMTVKLSLLDFNTCKWLTTSF